MSEPFNSFAGSDSGRLQSDLAQLAKKDVRAPKALPNRPNAAPIPAGVGSVRPKPATASQQSAGIASPLTETATTRAYHSDQFFASTNGLFVFVLKPIKDINFIDALGRDVKISLLP